MENFIARGRIYIYIYVYILSFIIVFIQHALSPVCKRRQSTDRHYRGYMFFLRAEIKLNFIRRHKYLLFSMNLTLGKRQPGINMFA